MLLLIGVVHIIITFLMIVYVFFAPVKYDKYVFLYITFLTLHWLVFYGECTISYLYKKLNDHSYRMGSNVELTDIMDVLRVIEGKTGLKYETLVFVYYLFAYGAILSVIGRICILKSVKPLWFIIVYTIMTVVWTIMIKTGNNAKMFDLVFAIVLIYIIIYTILH